MWCDIDAAYTLLYWLILPLPPVTLHSILLLFGYSLIGSLLMWLGVDVIGVDYVMIDDCCGVYDSVYRYRCSIYSHWIHTLPH